MESTCLLMLMGRGDHSLLQPVFMQPSKQLPPLHLFALRSTKDGDAASGPFSHVIVNLSPKGTAPAARNSGSVGVLESHLPSLVAPHCCLGLNCVLWPLGFPPALLSTISFAVLQAGFPSRETFVITVPISDCPQPPGHGIQIPTHQKNLMV